jgi:hypothetical protein
VVQLPLAVRGNTRWVGATERPVLFLSNEVEMMQLAAGFHETPAGEALEALAISTGQTWYRFNRNWVLALDADLARARLDSQTNEEFRKSQNAALKALRTPSPAQWRLLERQGYLLPSDLNPVQYRAFTDFARLRCAGSLDIRPDAAQLQGCYIALGRTQDVNSPLAKPDLRPMLPTNDGGMRTGANIVVTPPPGFNWLIRQTLPGGSSLPKLEPIDPAEFPEAPDAGAAVTAEEWSTNPVPFVSMGAVDRAVLALANASPRSIVSGTRLALWPVPLKPGQPVTSRSIAVAMCEVTGGRWRRVGDTYALQPQPAVERALLLNPESRARGIALATALIRRTLTQKQLDALRGGGTVPAASLPTRGRSATRWIAALSLVSKSRLSGRSLTLQDCQIAGPQRSGTLSGRESVARVLLPTQGGEPRDVAQIRLN